MALRNLPKEEAIKSLSGIFNRDSQINGFNTATLLSGPITPNQKQEKSAADSLAMQLMREKAEAAKDNEQNQNASTGGQNTLSIPELYRAYKLNPNSKVAELLEQAIIERKYSDLQLNEIEKDFMDTINKSAYKKYSPTASKESLYGLTPTDGVNPYVLTSPASFEDAQYFASSPVNREKFMVDNMSKNFGAVEDYNLMTGEVKGTLKAPQTTQKQNVTTEDAGSYFSETDRMWNPYVNASEGQRFTYSNEYMTPEERSNYLALMQADVLSGKYTGNAEKYKDSLDLTSRMLQKKIEARKDDSYLSKIGTAVEAGLSDFASGITDFGNMMSGRNSSDIGHMFDADYTATRESIDSDVGKFFFDVTRTTVRNAASQVFGLGAGSGASIAYSIVSGAGAAGNAYNQSLQEGHSKEEAFAYGLISGLSETIIEYASGAGRMFGGYDEGIIGHWNATIQKNAKSAVTKFMANFGLNALGEAGEEYLQALGEKMFRNIAYGENNKYEWSDLISEEALYNALLGAMSGGMMGSVSYSVNLLANNGRYDYAGGVEDSAKATGVTDTEVINEAAKWSKNTKTPVLFTEGDMTDPISGTPVQILELDGVVFLSAKATDPIGLLVAHDAVHTAQNTPQYQALLNEVASNFTSFEDAIAQTQKYFAETYNINYDQQQAAFELVAMYVSENLQNSPQLQQFVRDNMGNSFRRYFANRRFNRQYSAADAQTQGQMRMTRDFAEALRGRQRLTPSEVDAVRQKFAQGNLEGAQYSVSGDTLADVLAGNRNVDAELQEAIDTYGEMNVDRPVATPSRVDDSGQKVSQAASTFLNNAETQQEVKMVKAGIVDAQYNYDPIKIEAAKGKARARIEGENGIGYDAAAKEVESRAADTDADAILNISPADYVYYGELYDMAVAQGDYETAQNCLLVMFEAASVSGKILAIQRNRMRNILNGISRSRAIQRDIARLNNGFSPKYIEKYGRIEIPAEMYETLEKAVTPEEIQAAENAIYESAAEQWKATGWEKWRNYRYLAMLGNLKTWNKNDASNWANFGLSHSDNLVSVIWQKLWGKFDFEKASVILWHKTEHGKKIQPDVHARSLEMAEAEATHKYQDRPQSEIESRRNKFGDSKIGRFLEKASDFTDNTMQTSLIQTITKGKRGKKIAGGDKAMFARAWEFYAGNYMVANNLTEITAEVENYATKAAQELVFHSENGISNAIQKVKQSGKAASAIIDLAMPFVRTPANVLQQGFQRSPAGLIINGTKLVTEMVQSHKNGGKVSAQTLNKFSRGVTGSMLFALGMLLSGIGFASGKEDESAKGRSASELGGGQPLSFNVFGTRIAFDWLEPASYPFLVGVLFQEGIAESDKSGAVFEALCAGYNEIFDMSMLAGLTEIFDTGSYGQDSNMVGDALAKLFTNAATQSIPTAVGQLARTIDPTRRKTTSGDSVFTDALGDNFLSDTLSTIAARIPGASYLLEPERDVWGNEVGRSGDNVFLNAVNQFISPAAINGGTGYEDDLVTQIVMDLYEKTGDAKVIPTEVDKNKAREELGSAYNSENYQELRQDVGEAQHDAIYELITSNTPIELYDNYVDANGKKRRRKYTKTFSEMTDEEKVKVISKTSTEAKSQAIEDYVEAFANILP